MENVQTISAWAAKVMRGELSEEEAVLGLVEARTQRFDGAFSISLIPRKLVLRQASVDIYKKAEELRGIGKILPLKRTLKK